MSILSKPILLKAGHTVLELHQAGRLGRGKQLPSPALYCGAVGLSDHVGGISSDAFKRRLIDTQGRAHDLTDATIEECYRVVDEPLRGELVTRHWSQLAKAPKP